MLLPFLESDDIINRVVLVIVFGGNDEKNSNGTVHFLGLTCVCDGVACCNDAKAAMDDIVLDLIISLLVAVVIKLFGDDVPLPIA